MLKGLGIQRTSNVVFKLPSVDGIPGTFLKTDGYGNLSFDANSGSSGSGSSLWTANGSKIYYNHNNKLRTLYYNYDISYRYNYNILYAYMIPVPVYHKILYNKLYRGIIIYIPVYTGNIIYYVYLV